MKTLYRTELYDASPEGINALIDLGDLRSVAFTLFKESRLKDKLSSRWFSSYFWAQGLLYKLLILIFAMWWKGHFPYHSCSFIWCFQPRSMSCWGSRFWYIITWNTGTITRLFRYSVFWTFITFILTSTIILRKMMIMSYHFGIMKWCYAIHSLQLYSPHPSLLRPTLPFLENTPLIISRIISRLIPFYQISGNHPGPPESDPKPPSF